jgi:putative restriction endonuclease
MPNRIWTEDELVLAMVLYWRKGSSVSKTTKEVVELATKIGRSPTSVVFKLGNLASCDPEYLARGRRGFANRGKGDKKVWDQYYNDWEKLLFAEQVALARIVGGNLEDSVANEIGSDGGIDLADLPPEGLTREALVRVRVTQHAFRQHILAIYNGLCCMTGISEPGLLTASHIVPWSQDVANRMNPSNGLCLNALHDRAFDRHYITVSADNYRIVISRRFNGRHVSESMRENFVSMAGREITLPEMSKPDRNLLRRHNERFFRFERRLPGAVI